ncbi:hypothetical protein Tco_0732828 [Tanacetum coccineum]
MFKQCSAMDLGTRVVFAGFQANMSRLLLSKSLSSIFPFSGWLPTIIPFATVGLLERDSFGASTTILHSAGIMPGRLIIPLYGDGDLTTIKFIKAFVECSSSPKDTISDICPNGQDISPLNPKSEVMAGVIRFLISGRSLLKQCSYNTSEAEPTSMYMRWMRCSSTSALITIGFSCPPLLAKGGKEIS